MKNFFDNDTAKAVYYVYLYGGVSKAGEKLHLSQSAMSRKIQIAEERAGIQIFDRDYHRFTPTKEGLRYIDACKQILHIGDAALKDAHTIANEGKKEIRIRSTPSLAASWLPIVLAGFSDAHPDIKLVISSDIEKLDILDTDILISSYKSDDGALKRIKLFEQQQGLFASEKYLEAKGIPEKLEDLRKHDLLAIDQKKYGNLISANWLLHYGIMEKDDSRTASMEFNSNDGRMQAITYGHGIGPISLQFVKLAGLSNVVRVLPQISSEPLGIYFNYNAQQLNTDVFDRILNFIQNHIDSNPESYS